MDGPTGYHSIDVRCRCGCGHEWDGASISEYGTGWMEPEECPKCGSSEFEADELDSVDIEERRLESRGVDF